MIKQITIKNFRNFDKFTIMFNKNINIIYGTNGSGKTNLLESIFFILNLKSFQTNFKKKIIKFNNDYFNISALLFNDNVIDITYNHNGSIQYLFNNISITKKVDFISFNNNANTIIFIPKNFDIILKFSSLRRNHIDYNIFQANKIYLQYLKNYNKYLISKNKLLKTSKTSEKFNMIQNILNKKLALIGSRIIYTRISYINIINKYIKKIKNDLKLTFDFELLYKPSIKITDKEININSLEKTLFNSMNLLKNKEILYGNSLIGAHKDDILFLLDNKDIKFFASRGQIKLCILMLQLAHYEYLSKNNINNLLIIDDIFSEIDDIKNELILNKLKNYNQVFISCCNELYINQLRIQNNDNNKINYINIENKNIVTL